MSLGAALVAMGVLALGPGTSRPEPGRVPPFDPGTLEGRAPDGTRVQASLDGPSALLYVDQDCPYCRAEVSAWAGLARQGGVGRGPTVIVASTSVRDARARLPGLDALSWYRDVDGSIARALGVTAVPFLALTGAGGRVVEVRMGRMSPEERARMLEHLDLSLTRRKP